MSAAAAAASSAAAPWWLAPATIGALIAFVAGIVTLAVSGRRARVDRQRAVFAAAFADIAAYREFVYIVRRRRHDEPEAERVRISTELSAVQARLNQSAAVLRVEAPRVAGAYEELLRTTRHIAGGAIRDGWNTPAITNDTDIHVNIDLTAIDGLETAYLLEVRDHLAIGPGAAHRGVRRAAAGIGQLRAQLTAHTGDVDPVASS